MLAEVNCDFFLKDESSVWMSDQDKLWQESIPGRLPGNRVLIHKGLFNGKVDIVYDYGMLSVVKGPYKSRHRARDVIQRSLTMRKYGSRIALAAILFGNYVLYRPLLEDAEPEVAEKTMYKKDKQGETFPHVVNVSRSLRDFILTAVPEAERLDALRKLVTKDVVLHHMLAFLLGYGDQGVNNLLVHQGQIFGIDYDENRGLQVWTNGKRKRRQATPEESWLQLLTTSRLPNYNGLGDVMENIYATFAPQILEERRGEFESLPNWKFVEAMYSKK